MEGHTTDDEQCVCPSVGVEIVRTVATQTGRDPTTLPPLYEYVDPDALESVFEPTSTGDRPGGTVSFVYDEYHVTVSFGEHRSVVVAGTDGQPVSGCDSPDVDAISASSPETAD